MVVRIGVSLEGLRLNPSCGIWHARDKASELIGSLPLTVSGPYCEILWS